MACALTQTFPNLPTKTQHAGDRCYIKRCRGRHYAANEGGRMSRWRLTGAPSSRQPPATIGDREGRAFGACCFAGKLRSPAAHRATRLTRPSLGAATLRESLRRPPAYPLTAERPNHRWSCPLGGSGAARPRGALRAIDATAWPRSWWTCGPRRLRRLSTPALLATHSDTAVSNRTLVSVLALHGHVQGLCRLLSGRARFRGCR
jgi:hypothetical protein